MLICKKNLCYVSLLLILLLFIGGCGSSETRKAADLFKQAEQVYQSKDFNKSKELLASYIQQYPNERDASDAKSLLKKTNDEIVILDRKAKRTNLIDTARKTLGLSNDQRLDVTIVDNITGTKFITMAMHIPDYNKEKFIVAIADFDRQSSGWGHIIYFVKDTNYSLANKRELAYKVVAVYASTTSNLQILDSNGKVIEEMSL